MGTQCGLLLQLRMEAKYNSGNGENVKFTFYIHEYTCKHTRVSDGLNPGLFLLFREIRW